MTPLTFIVLVRVSLNVSGMAFSITVGMDVTEMLNNGSYFVEHFA